MWSIAVTREEFLDIVASGRPPSNLARLKSATDLLPSEMIIAWPSAQPRQWELPTLVVLPNLVRDFLAWTSTYLAMIKPLTAFSRVISTRQLSMLLDAPELLSLGRLQNGWIGAIVGEALESVGDKVKASELPIRNCLSTFLFAMARASALGVVSSEIIEIGDRWDRARKLVGGYEDLGNGSRRAVLQVLMELTDKYSSHRTSGTLDVVTICRALLDNEGRRLREFDELLSRLGISSPDIGAAREDQIQVYENVVRRVRGDGTLDKSAKSFLVALALSRVAPGSIEYMDLLSESRRDFPGVLSWYGLCAGLSAKSEVQSQFDSLGRKVAKELEYIERPDGRPRCDLSIDEFEVLMSGVRPVGWRSANPGQITIELAPLVYTTFRWSVTRRTEQNDLFEGRSADLLAADKELQVMIEELRSLLDQSRLVADRLSKRGKPNGGFPSERPKTRRGTTSKTR